MKKIFITVLVVMTFLGCSSEVKEAVESKLVVNHNLSELKLNDQNGKPHSIEPDTKKIIFSFSKKVGHICNKFFDTKTKDYLTNNKVQFIVDITPAPSIIKSILIMPELKGFQYDILIINDEKISAEYQSKIDIDRIVVADVENQVIKNIKYIDNAKELEEYINQK
jgi:hypothetical protein